jgi:DNA-binding response OmpR family regulator
MGELSCRRVLIVEDNGPTARVLERLLVSMGWKVKCTATISGAKQLLDEWLPHDVLLDLGLPDGNGIAVLEAIRLECRPIRVAIVTATRLSPDDRMLQPLKPDVVLHKPLTTSLVLDWLNNG